MSTATRGFVHNWSVLDVLEWLAEVGLEKYQESFNKHNINGAILIKFTARDMDILNIKVLAHRKLLAKSIKGLEQNKGQGKVHWSTLQALSQRQPPTQTNNTVNVADNRDRHEECYEDAEPMSLSLSDGMWTNPFTH